MAKVGFNLQPQGPKPAQQLAEVVPGLTIIEFVAQRLQATNPSWPLIIAVGDAPEWNEVAQKAESIPGAIVYRIDITNRLEAFAQIAKERDLDIIVRGTGDAWNDQEAIRDIVTKVEAGGFDMGENARAPRACTAGFGTDVITRKALERALTYKPILLPFDRGNVAPIFREWSDAEWAAECGVNQPFNVYYHNTPEGFTVPSHPRLICAVPDDVVIYQNVYSALVKAGKDPIHATMPEIVQVAAQFTPLVKDPQAGLTSPMSVGPLSGLQALIKQNREARLVLVRQFKLSQEQGGMGTAA